jgi:FkbM family methyltransferase
MLRSWERRRLLGTAPDLASRSTAQLHQDLWVLAETKRRLGGFFVEIGAFDGIEHSNTYLLEKEFGWTGILVEPNPAYHSVLRERRSAALSTSAVYSTTGKVDFMHVGAAAVLSGIAKHAFSDRHAQLRSRDSDVITVDTLTLNDLLRNYGAPNKVDYISIDTEGSEFEILAAFDFDAFDVRLFSIEHNFTPREVDTDKLMRRHGYRRVYRRASFFDAWYRRVR